MLSLMKMYKFDHTTVSIEYQLLRETYVLSKMKLLFQSWFLGVEVCVVKFNLPDNLPDKASPGETGSASRVTQTEIVYKVTHLYNVFPIAA